MADNFAFDIYSINITRISRVHALLFLFSWTKHLNICNSWKISRNTAMSSIACGSAQNRVGSRREIGAISPLKPAKVTLFTIILCISENNIRDSRPFSHPLFCRSSVVMCTSPILQQWAGNETWLPNITEIAPH